jgi:two-component system, chemotaxis family, CheB/CheR fusion protein
VSQPDPAFEELLVYLRDTRGFDLTGYKRTSLTRRVDRRMAQVGVSDYAEYLDHLQVHSEEFTALFNTILINVTGFFRDPDAWAALREEVLPGLLAAKGSGELIRIWSAGCASGEEAYTLAIVLAEMLGLQEFRQRVKIYATDVDEESLTQARQANYSPREIRGVDEAYLEKYFEQSGGRFVFRKDLRRAVIFGRNDLVQDAPISRIDLLVCRNSLMYFTAETQARILSRFHFALADAGVLFLGKAEMLLSHSALFLPIDLKRRIFRKVARTTVGNGAMFSDAPMAGPRNELTGLELLRDETLMTAPVAQVVLTADGGVALVNHRAEYLFGVSARDVGRPFRDLDLSYRPVELRHYIEQAQAERRTVRVPDVRYMRAGEQLGLEVDITPLSAGDRGVVGVSVVFHDVTEAQRLHDELEQTNQRLETAYEELQSTNEELETTNEELQSTVEELETTNEELQSTNEELETMNEELQSTNDELQTINDELQDRTADLDQANGFLGAILSSLRAGVVVLGRELQVQVWNRQAEELWGMRSAEAVGEHFLNLDIGLPLDLLRPLIRQTLGAETGLRELGVSAVNRRGRPIAVRVLASPLRGTDGEAAGVILMMEQEGAADRADARDAGGEDGRGDRAGEADTGGR